MDFSESLLFQLARSKIESFFTGTTFLTPPIPPSLQVPGAAFVTLTIAGKLRGCIGSLIAHRPLWVDIQDNGYNAAFHDFRFAPLTSEEYPYISVEISIVSPPEQVNFKTSADLKSIIIPHRDGILFSCHGYRSTFLPQVWQQLPDFDQFFSQLSLKAGLGATPDWDNVTISRYTVERYHE